MITSFTDGDAALQQHSANLVDHRGAAHNPPLAHPMQRLQVELVIVLIGTSASWDGLLPRHTLQHRCSRSCSSSRTASHTAPASGVIMPLFPQSAAEKMRSSASLHADQTPAKVRR